MRLAELSEVREALKGAPRVQLAEGEVAFSVGDACGGLPLVLEGRIRVLLTHPGGRERLWYEVRPGDLCLASACALFAREPLRALAVAGAPTKLAMLSNAAFDRLLATSDTFRAEVLSTFGRRMAHDLRELYAETFLPGEARLARWLARAGPRVRVTHAELAVRVGLTREATTRALARLESAGLVRLGRGSVEVIDEDGLRRVWESA